MTRILPTIASLSLLLLAAALLIGLSMGDLYQRPRPSDETLEWATTHRLTGVAAALSVVFVESVIVTYFIGTSRWCREVVDTYKLDPALVRETNRLKRRTFPWALLGMLTVIGVSALGAAADPATGRPDTASWTNWHLVAAFAGMLAIAATYVIAWSNVVVNQNVIETLVGEVERVRRERGLEVDPRPDFNP